MIASTADSPNDNGDKDDERRNNSDYLILGHVLTHTVAVQLRPSIGKGKGRREANMSTFRSGAKIEYPLASDFTDMCQEAAPSNA